MKILFFGDVFGRSGREAVIQHLPILRNFYKPDVVIANVENIAHGFGSTVEMITELEKTGVNVFTGGNHTFDKKEFISCLSSKDYVLRPHNISQLAPGKGFCVHQTTKGALLVINVMGRLFMENFLSCPFMSIKEILTKHPLGHTIKAVFVDFHGETTSEKTACAHYFDGQISALIGTHTHIPTADSMIMPNGTALQCDAGMCGDYNSVIGLTPQAPIANFLKYYPKPNKEPATGVGTVCGCVIDIGPNGLAKAIVPFALGPWIGKPLVAL